VSLTAKMRKREPEVASGSAKVSRRAGSSFEREKLAAQVEQLALEAFRSYEQSLNKLAELRPLIARLRDAFMKLHSDEKIAGCRTWTDFCERVLHRTDRRIRQILSGANPASEKHSRKSLEANKGLSAVPEPKTVKVPEAPNAEWTREMVVDTSFDYVYSVFQKAKLAQAEHNEAVVQLIGKLRHEIFLGYMAIPATET
jgi:hypothetical protein